MKPNLTILFLIAFTIASCTSFKPVAKSSDYSGVLKEGDVIRITPSDGSKTFRFKIEEVETDTLRGMKNTLTSGGNWIYESKSISSEEIGTLKKREVSKEKNLALTICTTLFVGLFVVPAIAFALAF